MSVLRTNCFLNAIRIGNGIDHKGGATEHMKTLYNADNDVAKSSTSYKSRNNPYTLSPW